MYTLFYALLQLLYNCSIPVIGLILYYTLQFLIAGFCVACLHETDDLNGKTISRIGFAIMGLLYVVQIYYFPHLRVLSIILGVIAFIANVAFLLALNGKKFWHTLYGVFIGWGLGLSYAVVLNLVLMLGVDWWIPIIAIGLYTLFVIKFF